MANRYWVGGTGTWSTSTANWSTTSGGAGGASVPGVNDYAIIDASSGSGTYTITRTATGALLGFQILALNAGTTLTFAGTSTWSIGGSGALFYVAQTGAGTLNYTNSGIITFTSSAAILTLNTVIPNPVTLNTAGAVLTQTNTFKSSASLSLFNGSYDLGGYDAQFSLFTTSTVTNTRSVVFGSNYMNLSQATATTVITISNATGWSCSGTGGFKLTGTLAAGSKTISIAALPESAAINVTIGATGAGSIVLPTSGIGTLDLLNFNGTWAPSAGATYKFWGSVILGSSMTYTTSTAVIALASTTSAPLLFGAINKTVYRLNLSGTAGTGTVTFSGLTTITTFASTRTGSYTLSFPAADTVTVGTWSVAGTAANPITINSTSSGIQATLSVASGTVNPGYASIQDSNATGGATFSAANGTNLGNNTGWIFPASSGFFLLLN